MQSAFTARGQAGLEARDGGEPLGGGREFVELDEDGRIRRDYRFILR